MLTFLIVVYEISILWAISMAIIVKINWIHIHTWQDESKQICSAAYCPERDKIREN